MSVHSMNVGRNLLLKPTSKTIRNVMPLNPVSSVNSVERHSSTKATCNPMN